MISGLVLMVWMPPPGGIHTIKTSHEINHETVRFWWNRCGPLFASYIRRGCAQGMRQVSRWRWHLDEMYVKINGEQHYLWRAVDHRAISRRRLQLGLTNMCTA